MASFSSLSIVAQLRQEHKPISLVITKQLTLADKKNIVLKLAAFLNSN